MSKEQQELLDDAYENYWNSHPDADKIFQYEGSTFVTRRMTEDEFVDMVKTDDEFSEKWGLKIEERELNDDELNIANLFKQTSNKLITITYNNKKIESYE
jgi:hypothetical protein